ncbi:beta-glucosidase-like glycosyl hydrolase [gamma proteobacterium HIMB55]|nr:beta-glucosidase-like glycosyl hydrolase [gamma proteobacterium HIMB55]
MRLLRLSISTSAFILLLSACQLEKPSTANSVDSSCAATAFSMDEAKSCASAITAQMTIEQKVGQMIQGEIRDVTPEDVRVYGLGSVLNGGGSFPQENKYATVEDWVALADAYYTASMDTSSGGAGIPIVWGTDAVHGHNNVMGATLFPHNIGLGATRDTKLVSQIIGATAREVKATGIDWIFAPTVAVAKDARWGRTYESFSSDPQIAASFVAPIVDAMQAEGIASTAKHFIGDGGTLRGDDRGETSLPLEELVAIHGQGYVEAIDKDVMSVMSSFNSWYGDKIHGSKAILTDLLRGDMGFEGMVVSDWNGVGEVLGCTNDNCAQAVNAGIDMVMVPADWRSLYNNMLEQVAAGEISEARIDEAVSRILVMKIKAGLFTRGLPSQFAAEYRDQIGHTDHRAIAREAVRKSQVLLKNNQGLLPLPADQHYLVTGPGADDIGQQSGGWTISWQGTGNTNADFPGATSILGGLKQQLEAAGGSITTDESAEVDAAIFVFGETPYAEMQGDVYSVAWYDQRAERSRMKALKERGIPVVAVFLTGRPMWVNDILNLSDAFVVSWLPGSEGQGVADVLLQDADGGVQHDFTGRLPMPWPALDVNAIDRDLPVDTFAFPIGYGLSVTDAFAWSDLSEVLIGADNSLDQEVFNGGPRGSWKLFSGDSSDWAVEATSSSSQSSTGSVTIEAIDRLVQEDARRLTFTGAEGRLSQVYMQSEYPTDLTALNDAGGALSIDFRIQSPPTSPVSLRMDCKYPCSGAVRFTKVLLDAPVGEWTKRAVPVACFQEAGLNLAQVNTAFVLATEGDITLDISEIKLTTMPEIRSIASCADLVNDTMLLD